MPCHACLSLAAPCAGCLIFLHTPVLILARRPIGGSNPDDKVLHAAYNLSFSCVSGAGGVPQVELRYAAPGRIPRRYSGLVAERVRGFAHSSGRRFTTARPCARRSACSVF